MSAADKPTAWDDWLDRLVAVLECAGAAGPTGAGAEERMNLAQVAPLTRGTEMQTILPEKIAIPTHRLAKFVADFLMELKGRTTLPDGVFGVTADDKVMFRGDVLFELKATHGFPLDFALDRIINEGKMAVDWVAFIEAARANGWWDFQTYDVICHGMEDAGLPKDVQDGVRARFQLYVLSCPHPRLAAGGRP